MNQEQRALEQQRGLRFPFNADAKILPQSSPEQIPARVTELSLRGCFLETSAALKEQQRVRVKIFHSDKHFEALADVIYVKSAGVGLVFGDMEPHFRNLLQAWILSALDHQAATKRP